MYNSISFIERCLNKSAAPHDVDAYVEYWHTHDTRCSLREYLGMTVKEYELWLKDGDSVLTDILQGRQERNAGKRYMRGLSRKEA